MARKQIGINLDDNDMNSLNDNFKELYDENGKLITSSKLGNGSVTNDKLGVRSVTWDKLDEGAVTSSRIANNAVGTSKIEDESVTNEKLGVRAVSNTNIDTGAVDTAKLALGSVYGSRIRDKGITNTHLSTGSVSRDNLQEGAVNASRIADKSVWERHIMTNAINRSMLQDNSIDYTKVEFDSLTLNKGKVFPMQQIGPDNKEVLLKSILDAKVQFAEIGAKYSISFIAKDTTSWEETPQTFFQINKSYNDFESDEILIGRFETDEQMIGNNQVGIKSHVIRWGGMDEIFTITVDWDELEPNNNFRTGQVTNYIINPSQYFFKRPSKNEPADGLEGKLAFEINGREIKSKKELNGNENIIYEFGSLTPNDFFEITGVSIQPSDSYINDFSGRTLLKSSTDWVSPYRLLADNNPLGNSTITVGGGHGTEGGNGFPTGEYIGIYDIRLDGATVSDGNHIGYSLTFRVEHYVSASNAINIETGNKRNSIKEMRYYKIDKKGIHIEVKLIALEDVTFTGYAGLQTIQRDTFDYFFIPNDIPQRKYKVTGLTDWMFPTLEDPLRLDRVVMYNSEIVMTMKMDREYGIGTGEFIPESTKDRLQRPIHATPNIGKIYMHNLGRSSNNFKLSEGEEINYRGQYDFSHNRSNTENILKYIFNDLEKIYDISAFEVI